MGLVKAAKGLQGRLFETVSRASEEACLGVRRHRDLCECHFSCLQASTMFHTTNEGQMPILAYEEHNARSQVTKAISKALKIRSRLHDPLARQSTVLTYTSGELKMDEDRIDTSLVEAYVDSEKPIHCRRTLDQYEYYMLENTEARDMDQVVYRWAEKRGYEDKKRPVIMVDQLWLWVLPNGGWPSLVCVV